MTRRFLWVCAVALAALTTSMGAPEQPSWTGKISVSGNEPFTFVALTEKSGHQWRLTGALTSELRARAQGLVVHIYGNQHDDVIDVERWTPGSP
jgi:hypothetical protein